MVQAVRRWSGLLAAAAAGYACGLLPTADLVARAASGGRRDLRREGSGNPGAANAIAVLGPGWGGVVLAGDVAKGVVACVVGRRLGSGGGANLAGTMAVVGHCFPVTSRFRGGKGVATSAGQVAATLPAYLPIDLGVAYLASTGPWRRRAWAATTIASVAWVGAAALWWRRGWPNLWGPPPTASLPLAAAATSALIFTRFLGVRTVGPPASGGPAVRSNQTGV